MKRLPIVVAGLALLAVLATACGGSTPTATALPPASSGREAVQDEQTAAQPQLLYFYADW